MNCPVCNKKKYKKIFETNKNTKYNLEYHDDFYKAISTPFIKVSFVECDNCNFLFNKIYKQLDYKIEYNANRSYSKVFDNYLDSVVKFLDTNFLSKRGGISNILEVGYGDGEFLKKLSNSNNFKNKNFYGFDPSIKKNYKIGKCKLSTQYYNEKTKVKPDLIILRHTLEHISKVKFFLNQILHENPKYLFIEVPCKSFVYDNNFDCFHNEHCSYFDEYSIQVLLKHFKYKKIRIKKAFKKEYLLVIFEKTNKNFNLKYSKSDNYFFNFKRFKKNMLKKIDLNKDFIWGAAGKGVVLSNLLGLNHNNLKYIVDINAGIQGKFLPGSGIEVISPHNLKKYIHKKSKIFTTNKLYLNEIKEILKKENIFNQVYPLFND